MISGKYDGVAFTVSTTGAGTAGVAGALTVGVAIEGSEGTGFVGTEITRVNSLGPSICGGTAGGGSTALYIPIAASEGLSARASQERDGSDCAGVRTAFTAAGGGVCSEGSFPRAA